MSVRSWFALAMATASFAVAPSVASASGVAYPDADWTESWIQSPSSAGDATLHADVLRPKGYTNADKTSVILSIGPYFNHSGQTGPAGPAEGTNYDPVGPNAGPSERFQDFVDGSGLLKKGYTYVMVDLRGFGGSNGCLDWSGPGEQADVVNAVKWATSQPWSTGRVGMYGKSYDALTGLIGVDRRPPGLGAVVAQEPVYDDYRYLYGDGVRRLNSVATPALYDGIAATPGPLADDNPNYNQSSLNSPDCLAENWAAQAGDDNHDSDFWKLRNLIPGATGSNVPLFLTQGLTENNTVADGLQEYLANHTGYERGWLGPWEHVRGNETCASGDSSTGCDDSNVGRLKMGRAGWFDEVMRFYGRYLKGQTPTVADPPFAVDHEATVGDLAIVHAYRERANVEPDVMLPRGVAAGSKHDVLVFGFYVLRGASAVGAKQTEHARDVYDVFPAQHLRARIGVEVVIAIRQAESTLPEMHGVAVAVLFVLPEPDVVHRADADVLEPRDGVEKLLTIPDRVDPRELRTKGRDPLARDGNRVHRGRPEVTDLLRVAAARFHTRRARDLRHPRCRADLPTIVGQNPKRLEAFASKPTTSVQETISTPSSILDAMPRLT